ncbi:hypothetical protein AB3G45_29130 [Shinella sp. S4-D37]|uniref:hypothetical protein n=1 Tax=Shinella sp. S4-D37 TaxID=3161999 RepID=UPI00346769C6
MPRNFQEYVRPRDDAERVRLESLVRADYDRSHPGDTFDDMKRRAVFAREDRGLYRDWLAIAAARSAGLSARAAANEFPIAAE